MHNPPDPILESIDGDRYRVAESFAVKYNYWFRELQFEVPVDYVTDLASIPWLVRWVADRASLGLLAPLVHDYLCDCRGRFVNIQGEVVQLTHQQVHLYFLVAMQLDGISWRRSLVAFLGVLIGGPRWPTPKNLSLPAK